MDIPIRTWVIISILVVFLFLVPGINHGLWMPDEPRVAGTCAEMARTHDYVVPSLNGQPFLEKPPLYYAAGGVAGYLLGVDKDVPYRIVSLIFGVFTILITFLMVSRKDGPLMGIIAAGMLASAWEIFMLSRWIQVDIALVFGVTLAMFAYQRWLDTSSAVDSIILGLGTGIAFMSKGLVGPAIIAAAIVTDIIRQRDIKIAWRIRPFLVLGFILIAVLPWMIALWDRGGWPFLRVAIVVNNLMRFTGAPEGAALGHQNGPLYYIEHFPGGIAPWTLIFIPAFFSSIRKFKEDRYISWFIGPFVLLSLASTKRGIYLAPLYPAVICMTASWLEKARRVKWEDVLVKITWAVSVAGCFAPFAGIFLGLPVLGTILGLLSVGALVLITRGGVKQREAVSLVMVTSIALFSCTTVYYQYMKPQKDYLDFTRQALVSAGNKDITMIAPREILRGVVSLTTGKVGRIVDSPADIKKEGIYIWEDKDNRILDTLNRQFKVKMLLEKKMDRKGHETARLADVIPDSTKKESIIE
jgi:4-amino-4-deoxy-L-arabinose transferase-like glycosyltransferase